MREPLTAGSRLGRYEIVELLGKGGMGEVYRARDHELGRDVALKVVSVEFAGREDRRRRFELEARAAAALNHPNIVAIHDVGEHNGTPFIVSELLGGQTLRARLTAQALPIRKVLQFAVQLADGLASAHEKGIVHRDLKPENVFVTPDERVKILDFGLAKLVEDASVTMTAAPATASGAILGTVGYLSPEQASGLAADHRADIFSFGVVLFEMVMHRRAFGRATAAETLSAIVTDDPMASAHPKPGIETRVLRVAGHCLEKAPDRRFQSARDLSLLLQAELAEANALTPASSALRVPRGPLLIAGSACLIAGLLLGSAVTWNRRPGAAAADPAVRLTVALPDGLPSSYGSPVAISPDGRQLVIAMTSSNRHQLYLRPIDRDEMVPLPGTEGAEFPFFSPDGEWIGFWSENKLRRVSVHGGFPVVVADSPEAPFRGADWSQTHIVFAPLSSGALSQVDTASGTVTPATVLDAGRREFSHRWPQVLAGGRGLLYTALSGSGPTGGASVRVRIVATGETRELIGGAVYARYLGDGVLLYVSDGQPFIAPFDLDRMAIAGDAQALDELIATRAASGATFLSVSQNGTLAFVKSGREDTRTLVWVNEQGAATPVGLPAAAYSTPTLSPNGRRVALNIAGSLGTADLFIVDFDSQVRTRLTTDGQSRGSAAWSPDGTRLLYNSTREGPTNLFVQPVAGAERAERLVPGERNQFAGSWLRDDSAITYMQGPQSDLWVVRLSDRKAAPLLTQPGRQFGGRVSPDGRWLAYTSDTSGVTEAFVTTYPQPLQHWQVSSGGGQEPVWSADSRHLYFRHGSMMMAVPINPAAYPPTSRATTLFDGAYLYEPNNPGLPNYDVGPDGRFLMISSEAGPAAQVQVALNWVKTVKARLLAQR